MSSPNHGRSVELLGSARRPVVGAKALGVPRRDEPVDVTVLLRRRAPLPPRARKPVRASDHLTREEFAARHGWDPADRDAVRSFAATAGLSVGSEAVGPRTLHLSGDVGTMEREFGTRLHRWTGADGSYRGRQGPLTVPTQLEGVVVGVFGLDNRRQCRTHFRRRPASARSGLSYSPPQVGKAYRFPLGGNAAGQTIALLELGGGYTPEDLAEFFAGLSLPPPAVSAVSVDGATNAPTGSADGPDGEVELDIEVAGSLAVGAGIAAYFAPNTDQGFLDGLTSAIHDSTRRPNVVSISWGGPESSWTAQAMNAIESACEDAAAMGVSVTAAAGDQGATDGTSGGTLEVDFPASAPHALACGGTKLAISNEMIGQETVWNELPKGDGATGGGVSRFFPVPDYQSAVHVPPAPGGHPGRGVPDVAGNADPATGYAVRVDGGPEVIGGTSAVAPLYAALIALMNESLGAPLGFVNSAWYSSGPAKTFHDIVSGGNGGYSAGPGWDACTGLGSPDGAALLEALRGSGSPPSPGSGPPRTGTAPPE